MLYMSIEFCLFEISYSIVTVKGLEPRVLLEIEWLPNKYENVLSTFSE